MNDTQLIEKFLAITPTFRPRARRGSALFIRGDALHHQDMNTTLAAWGEWQGQRVVFVTTMDLATRAKRSIIRKLRAAHRLHNRPIKWLYTPDPLRPDAERMLRMILDQADENIAAVRRFRAGQGRFSPVPVEYQLDLYLKTLELWNTPEPADLAAFRQQIEQQLPVLRAQSLIAA